MPLFEVKKEDSGKRLDVFLHEKGVPSRSLAKKFVEAGYVKVNDVVQKKASYKVKEGDTVFLEKLKPEPPRIEPEDLNVQILYQDEHLAVVCKPAGMVTHPARGHFSGTLVNALLGKLSLSGIGGVVRPGIVHRLDKETYGLLVVAKNDASHIKLSEMLKRRTISRKYIAIVHGRMEDCIVDFPVGRHPSVRVKMAVVPGGKPALTIVRSIQSGDRYSLIEAVLKTGRTHQVRVHCSYMGHPVVGDETYGGRDDLWKEMAGKDCIALVAYRLKFEHPFTGEPLEFSIKPPDYFIKFCERVNLTGISFFL